MRMRDLLWQSQLNAERSAVTESFSLLAVAAHATGDLDEFRWALGEARERGVDVTELARLADREAASAKAKIR